MFQLVDESSEPTKLALKHIFVCLIFFKFDFPQFAISLQTPICILKGFFQKYTPYKNYEDEIGPRDPLPRQNSTGAFQSHFLKITTITLQDLLSKC